MNKCTLIICKGAAQEYCEYQSYLTEFLIEKILSS